MKRDTRLFRFGSGGIALTDRKIFGALCWRHWRLLVLCALLFAEIAFLFPQLGAHDHVATVYIHHPYGCGLQPLSYYLEPTDSYGAY